MRRGRVGPPNVYGVDAGRRGSVISMPARCHQSNRRGKLASTPPGAGLAHGRVAVRPSEIQQTGALLQIGWLAGSLASVRRPAAFTGLLVSLAAALALLVIDPLRPSVVAGKLAGIIALPVVVAAGDVFATASRARGGPEYPLRRPIAR
jgi:hypothetical protein